MRRRKKVTIIQRILPHYRKPFFEQLRAKLGNKRIDLNLVYGCASEGEALKKDTVDISWAHKIRNRSFRFGDRTLYWQPCLHLLEGADLVIVEQASKLILNHVLLLAQLAGLTRLCFWGHGKNFQAESPNSIGEMFKRHMCRHVHWWFAYNDLSAAIVGSLGYPAKRITSVQNAIDTHELIAAKSQVKQEALESLRRKLTIKGQNTCIFVGGMYKEKNLNFLLDACMHIRLKVPDFEMLFIGHGQDAHIIASAAARFDWLHHLGPVFGTERVPYFMLSKLFLMPGLVGLGIVDSFALGTPLVTTNVAYHSPEIAYLQNGVNGITVANTNDPSVYANEVANLLLDDSALKKLVVGCKDSNSAYSLEEMVNRFAAGIENALEN
jgi:glycosyltransferase involved in cell wall biosynthesis